MIVNIDGRQREVKNLKASHYMKADLVNGGDAEDVEYAEYTVIGRNSEWVDWRPINEFRVANPGVII